MSERADFIIAETFMEYQEAKLALDCIKQYGKGRVSCVNMLLFIMSSMLNMAYFCSCFEHALP